MTDATPTIDLNADLGEGVGHDEELLDLVTSANIACGAHAGDAETIRATCAAAIERGVSIGAHPGYPDRENFGRIELELTAGALIDTLTEQLAVFASAAASQGATPSYVKAHGALYARVATDLLTASTIFATAAMIEPLATGGAITILGPPGAVLPAGPAGVAVEQVVEGFADRAYTVDADGRPTLVSRTEPGALLAHDAAVAQAVALATTGLATATDGTAIAVHPRSICVHGDSPGAVALAREIRSELERAGVRIEAFA